ncbi:MAG: hypothetical protein ACR2MN_14925 [Acidimicrobiales bacterium]
MAKNTRNLDVAEEIDARETVSKVTARDRVNKIRTHVEDIKTLVVAAYRARDWDVLGYATWAEYCTEEFGGTIAIPREERGDVVFTLRDAGLSTRAIGAAIGVSKDTVRNDLAGGEYSPPAEPAPAGVPAPSPIGWNENEIRPAPHPDDDEVVEAEIVGEPEPYQPPAQAVTGTDGKTYKAKTDTPAAPRRRPWADAYRDAIRAVEKAATALHNLSVDDRVTDTVMHNNVGNTNDLQRAVNLLTGTVRVMRPESDDPALGSHRRSASSEEAGR